MTEYLLKSGGCIVLFLGIYHLFLAGQKMYRFNRFFLLTGLIFSLLAPLITIEVPAGTLPLDVFKSKQSENLKALVVQDENFKALAIKDEMINSLADGVHLVNPDRVVRSQAAGAVPISTQVNNVTAVSTETVNTASTEAINTTRASTQVTNGTAASREAIKTNPDSTQIINGTAASREAINTTPASTYNTASAFQITEVLLAVYLLGLIVFALRFVWNLYQIKKAVSNHEKVPFKDAALVLLSEPITPYSFLNYIFVSKQEYQKGAIEDELYTHELAHVHQKHSADIIFIELVKIVFWFNPIFVFYKKAIQLNHEFLADDDVICTTDAVTSYQYLLLGKTLSNKKVNLASGLNYSVTKKRLLMMVKESSILRQRCIQVLLLPVVAALFSFISFSQAPAILPTQQDAQLENKLEVQIFDTKTPVFDTKTPAPETKTRVFDTKTATPETKTVQESVQTKIASPKLTKEIYYKASTVYRLNEHGRYIGKKYDEMSAAEKAALPNPPLPHKKINVTQKMLTRWMTEPHTYGVWVDNKRVKNETLANFSPADFSVYYLSKLTPAAKNYSDHSFQLDLTTNRRYQEYYVDGQFLPGKTITITGDRVVPYRLLDTIRKPESKKGADKTNKNKAKSERG